MRIQVVIIGAGPAGLLLGRYWTFLASTMSCSNARRVEHVLSRIRAGILEQTTVDLLKSRGGRQSGQEGIPHHAVQLAFDHQSVAIELSRHTGKVVTCLWPEPSPRSV